METSIDSEDDEADSQPTTEGEGCAGGCAIPSSACSVERDEAAVEELREISSVKVAVLDEEHEHCAGALRKLAAERDASALQGVLNVFETHFSHEEKLLD